MGNRNRRLLVFTLTIIVFSSVPLARATLDFQNMHAAIVLKAINAELLIGDNQQVFGCSERSIVKDFGHTTANTWVEAYANGSVIGQTGGTQVPQTDLATADSNAVVQFNLSLRTNSNAMLYTLRVNSAALLYGDRVNSSAFVSLASSVRTYSNAFAYGIKNNSNPMNALIGVPNANSIDGTRMVRYCTNNYVFHTGSWTARGFVRFNNGFTVMPSGSVLMDTLTTVSGGFDLGDTGMLILNNDLYLAHNVTLTDGGNIKGKSSTTPGAGANTIFMGGDLTLASTTYARTLHITGDWCNTGTSGDLIIDGGGHTLNIGDYAQIFVDQNVTLTLRNMTIKTGPKSLFKPAIQLASFGSKLALDNVLLDLGADFHFLNGQLFIHDEVAVTGTSAFVYNSPRPSYITSGATWCFDPSTTFSIAPVTYTDQLYTAGMATTNNFIVHADATSALCLNNCSVLTTFTGLRLQKGMVLFDNNVSINTQAGVDLNNTTPVGPSYIVQLPLGGNFVAPGLVAWSPDGRFLAVTGNNSGGTGLLQVCQFNGSAITTVGGEVALGTNPFSIAWSPDGRFLFEVNNNNNNGQVFSFNGSDTPTPVGIPVTTPEPPTGGAWSPDGRFLAVASASSNTSYLTVYRFNGSSTPVLLGSVSTGNYPWSVAWSPDGRFLAVANFNNNYNVLVFSFNGSSAPVLLATPSTAINPLSVAWSPDGRFLAVVNRNGSSSVLQIFSFNGSSVLTSMGTAPMPDGPSSIVWSPDGRFLAALIGTYSTTVYLIQFFRIKGAGVPVAVGTLPLGSSPPTSMAWSPDGRFVAVANFFNGNPYLQIYSCNYLYTGQPPQGFSNGLLFGNSVLGSAYDADVQMWGGASVTIKGMVKDDSA